MSPKKRLYIDKLQENSGHVRCEPLPELCTVCEVWASARAVHSREWQPAAVPVASVPSRFLEWTVGGNVSASVTLKHHTHIGALLRHAKKTHLKRNTDRSWV